MPNELKSRPEIVSLPSRVAAVVGLVLIVSLAISLPAFAQDSPASVRRVRKLETDDLGASNPAGLAYSPATKAFHVVELRQPVQLPAPLSDIIDIRPVGDRVGQVRMWATTADPINMAYDPEADRLLLYGTASGQLLEMTAGADGRLDPAMLARHDGRRFALQNPQGMAVDASSGDLFFLDSSGPRIVRVARSRDGGFEDAVVTEADVAQLNSSDLHGLAFNPANGHLYALSRAEQTLYELTQAGRVVASSDVSGFHLGDPQGMVFAPSGDLTDDPSLLSLYVADSGLVAGQERRTSSPAAGQIIELSFAQPAAVAAAGFVASMVQTVDTSLWLPPSPDPVGIAYLDSSNTLMVCDSEVNELPIFTGENLFRMRLSGELFDTLTTIPFTIEPSGIDYNPDNEHLFFSDDDRNEIYELDPGADGFYNTLDDIATSFDTEVFGSTDPTDVAFARGMGDLFVSDWVNSEVYHITPGANGVFDGVDDLVTSFDTIGLGVLNPEGIAFNEDNGHLYIVGVPVTATVETTVGGDFVQTIDISAANPFAPSALSFAPSSMDPNVTHIYITEWGLDNKVDPNENDGKVYEMTLPPITGSLSIVKEVEPASADPDEDITYTLSFSNDGEATVTGVTITDIIPVSVTVQSVVSSGVTITPKGSVSFTWGVQDLSPGEGGVITITAALSPTLPCGHAFTNTATITATTGDTDPSDNRSSATVAVGRGVVVTPPGASDSGDPGTDVVYTLSVENTGTCADTYDVSVSGNVWAVSAPATVGPVAAGADTDVDVTVTIRPDARCVADFATVTFTSQSGGTVADSAILTTTANTIYAVTVEPPSNAVFGDPGAVVTHTLWVSNTGNCVDIFDLSASGDDWPLSAPPTVGPLGPGMGARVDITATVPADAQCGDADTATITLGSQNSGTVVDSSTLTSLANTLFGVSVEPPSDAASGDPGTDLVYSLWVTNTGNCPDTFDRAFTGDEWTTKAPATVGPLDPGVGATVDVTVTVPLDAGCGDEDSATMTLTSQSDDNVSDASDLTTSANTVRGVVVEPTSNAAWDDPSAEVAYTLWVTNSGNCVDTFDLTLTGDEWTTEAPGTVGPLTAGAGSSVDVTVTVPVCSVGGADDASALRFSSQNDGTVWDSATLTTAANYVAPMASDEAYLALEDTPRVVDAPGVLGNDHDANCDPLSANLEATPANGTVVLKADGSFIYTPTVSFTGDDSFTYSASDGALDDTATVTLTVISAGDDPMVDAGENQTVDEGETVQFDGSFVDPARRILFAGESIHWDLGDGNTATDTLTPTHQYWDNGLYTVTLTVTDTAGDAGQDTLLVTVTNVAPTVNAGPDLPAVPGKPLSMSGDFSDPGLDDTHSIIWDLDDGTIILDTLTIDHTYGGVGVYTVTLTVIDDDAGVGSDTAVIGVWHRAYLPLVSRDHAP